MENNVVDLDSYRAMEDVIKQRLNADQVVVLATLKDGTFLSYIPNEITDLELVYLIQTLQDRRVARLRE